MNLTYVYSRYILVGRYVLTNNNCGVFVALVTGTCQYSPLGRGELILSVHDVKHVYLNRYICVCRFTSHFRMIEYFIVSRKTIVVIKALFMIIRRRLRGCHLRSMSIIVRFLIGFGNGGDGDPVTTGRPQPV